MRITVDEAIKRAEGLMYSDYHIHAGVERKAVAKRWNGKRIYINVYCYSLSKNYKGKYDLGYIEIADPEATEGEYHGEKAVVSLI